MELQYEKAMKANGLSYRDLPEDAQTGVDQIKDVLKGFALAERRGLEPSAKALKKLKAMDKWVHYEILDYLHDTDKNDDDIPFEADEVIDELESGEKAPEKVEADPVGVQVEAELEALYKSGKRTFHIDEIKSSAPMTYDIIWAEYEDDEENGVKTSKYSAVETQDGNFNLKMN